MAPEGSSRRRLSPRAGFRLTVPLPRGKAGLGEEGRDRCTVRRARMRSPPPSRPLVETAAGPAAEGKATETGAGRCFLPPPRSPEGRKEGGRQRPGERGKAGIATRQALG